jgi:hypothetical protein
MVMLTTRGAHYLVASDGLKRLHHLRMIYLLVKRHSWRIFCSLGFLLSLFIILSQKQHSRSSVACGAGENGVADSSLCMTYTYA